MLTSVRSQRFLWPLTAAAVLTVGMAAPGPAAGAGHRAPVAARASSGCPAAYPERAVHAGQRGYGLTTVHGTSPQRFSVRVLGVLRDGIGPGIDMIVISARSPVVDRAGTWQGMSGSPIYASDGRLIGALSYGIAYGTASTAGVTPAGAMYRMLSDPSAVSTAFARHVALPPSMLSTAADGTGPRAVSEGRGLQLLPTPLAVSGLPAGQLPVVRRHLRAAGAAPFSLHVAGTYGGSQAKAAASMAPGHPFAAGISYGDYTLAGIGTATAVCRGRVLAFGHPFMASGATSETAQAARVLYVQSDRAGPSFVVANVGPVFGTVNQDRTPGLAAVLDREPRTTTVVTDVAAPGTGLRRTGRTHVPVPIELPDATAGATFGNLWSTVQSETAGSAFLSWRVAGRLPNGSPWRFQRTDRLTDPFDVGYATAYSLYLTMNLLMSNPFDALSVSRVTVHTNVTEKVAEWELRGLSVWHGGSWIPVTPSTVLTTHPGRTLHLRALLQAYQNSGKQRTVSLSVVIPPSAGVGPGQLQVSGGGDLSGQLPDPSSVTSFQGLLRALRAVPRGDSLLSILTVPDFAGTGTINRTDKMQLGRVARGTMTLALDVQP